MVCCKIKHCKKRKGLIDGYCEECTVKQSENKDKHEYICPSCEKVAGKKECCMMCELCEKWFHITCVKLPKALYDILTADSDDSLGVKWFCPTCKPKSEEALDKYNSLEMKTENLSNDVREMKEEMKTIKTSIANIVRDEIDEGLHERNDIESRKMNLIVFGVPEQNSADGNDWSNEEKIEADMKLTRDTLTRELGTAMSPREGIVDARRLGLKSDRGPRPLKLVFNNLNTKRHVLTNAKKLRDSTDPVAKCMFINPDLTKRQREKENVLRDEMWKQRELGKNIVIKKGKLVEVPFIVNKVRKSKPTTSGDTVNKN